MTDLAHMTQLLQDAAHREHYTLPALRDWLRAERDDRDGTTERNRRLDSDAAAVQIMTVWVSKGLQYPIVYLPFAFNRWVPEPDLILFHDGPTRCLHVGGKDSPDYREVEKLGREESAGDDSRLTYVALTRAQAQVVAWWSPARDEPNGGLSRLLRGRRPGESVVPNRCVPSKINDDDALARLRQWEAAGGPVLEQSVLTPAPPLPAEPAPKNLDARHFHRSIDTTWRRTSYSGLIRVAETSGVSSEPEVVALDDEVGDLAAAAAVDRAARAVADGRSPEGREVRHAGARGAGDRRPVRGGPGRRVGDARARPLGVVAGRRARARAGRRAGADARHAAGPARRRPDAAPDRSARSAAGDGLRVPAGRRRHGGHGTGDPPARRRRPGGRVPAGRRPACLLRRAADGRRAGQPAAARVSERVRSTRCCASRTAVFPAAIATWSSTTSRTGWATATAP